MQEELLYKEMILDLYRNPLNKKELDNFSIEQKAHNPTCGDMVTVQMLVENDTVIDIGWTGEGCAISLAGVSLITDEVKGKTLEEVAHITQDDMIAMLGIPISHTRMKCALLGWQTIRNMIEHR